MVVEARRLGHQGQGKTRRRTTQTQAIQVGGLDKRAMQEYIATYTEGDLKVQDAGGGPSVSRFGIGAPRLVVIRALRSDRSLSYRTHELRLRFVA